MKYIDPNIMLKNLRDEIDTHAENGISFTHVYDWVVNYLQTHPGDFDSDQYKKDFCNSVAKKIQKQLPRSDYHWEKGCRIYGLDPNQKIMYKHIDEILRKEAYGY